MFSTFTFGRYWRFSQSKVQKTKGKWTLQWLFSRYILMSMDLSSPQIKRCSYQGV